MANLNVRMTDEEYQKISDDAANAGLSISDYVKIILMNVQLDINIRLKNMESVSNNNHVNAKNEFIDNEYGTLLETEWKIAWDNDLGASVKEFKKNGKTFKEFIAHIKDNDIDTDFIIVEE